MRRSSAHFISIICATLSACQPPTVASNRPDAAATPSQSVTSPVSMEELAGQWRISSIDGRLQPGNQQADGTEGEPSITFSRHAYGGTAGCNAMGGLALLDGGRYFTYPGSQTVMFCSESLIQQENIWRQVMGAGPLVERISDGRLRLSGANHVMELADRKQLPPQSQDTPARLAGTRWIVTQIDGKPFPGVPSRGTLGRLEFSADSWSATDGCRSASAPYEQEAGAIAAKHSAIGIAAAGCASSDGQAMIALSQMMVGRIKYVVGLNGELLMAGNGHRLIGELDRSAMTQAIPDLAGAWTLAAVDGAAAPDHWTFSFTGSGYQLATGCKPLQGIYIASEARFYAAPLPTIDIGCPSGQGAILNRIETILSGGPSLALSGSDLAISDDAGSLTLRRSVASKAQIAEITAPVNMGSFVLSSINGKSLALASGSPTLTLKQGTFSIATPCGRINGTRRKRGDKDGWFTDGDRRPLSGCSQADAARHEALAGAFNQTMRLVGALDGTMLIAGGGQWVIGNRRGNGL